MVVWASYRRYPLLPFSVIPIRHCYLRRVKEDDYTPRLKRTRTMYDWLRH